MWGLRIITSPVFELLILTVLHEAHPDLHAWRQWPRSHVWWLRFYSDIEGEPQAGVSSARKLVRLLQFEHYSPGTGLQLRGNTPVQPLPHNS